MGRRRLWYGEEMMVVWGGDDGGMGRSGHEKSDLKTAFMQKE